MRPSETSFGNAGLVSAGDAHAWASPDALRMLVKSLTRRDLGISVKPSLDPAFLAWIWRVPARVPAVAGAVNTLRKLRMALYSRRCINEIEARTGIDYHARKNGIVYFHRTQEALDTARRTCASWPTTGPSSRSWTASGWARSSRRWRMRRDRIAGAIYAPMDQTGDSAKFARGLAAWLADNRNVRSPGAPR
jgi:D-amino-acid dehydrogenase